MVSSTKRYISKLAPSFTIANLAVLIYCLPLLILGQDAHVGINDNLDSHVIWYRILTNNGLVFADSSTTIPEIMSAPRVSLYNEFFLLFWIHYLFDTFPAMVINQLLIHFIALWGMYFLLTKLKFSKATVVFGSVFFAFLPFSQFWGLSIAGQPWVLLALLQIEQKGITLKNILVLIIYVLYSNFYSVSFFYLMLVSLFYATRFIKIRSINWQVVMTIFSMVLLALVMEYRLIDSLFFDQSFVSARAERGVKHYSSGLVELLKTALFGHYTARSFLIFFLPVVMYASKLAYEKKVFLFKWELKFLIVTMLITLCVVVVPQIPFMVEWYQNSLLNIYGFTRLYTILPFWTALTGAICIDYVMNQQKHLRALKVYLILSLVVLSLSNPTVLALIPGNEVVGEKDKLSYREFFAEDLFTQIKTYINENQRSYKVASLGLHPSVAQYNGFHTIDGYLTNYPLAYKKEFRKIIANELSANIDIGLYFDKWGSRCYLFDDELGKSFLTTKEKSRPIKLLDIDCAQFNSMGGRFIISAVQVENFSCSKTQVKYHRKFEDDCWKLYLYEIR